MSALSLKMFDFFKGCAQGDLLPVAYKAKQQMGGAEGEVSSIRHDTGERGASVLTVRKGILLPVPEYGNPGERYDPNLGYDEPLQLLGDGDDSFAVKINNSLLPPSATVRVPPRPLSPRHLSISHTWGGQKRHLGDYGGRALWLPTQR